MKSFNDDFIIDVLSVSAQPGCQGDSDRLPSGLLGVTTFFISQAWLLAGTPLTVISGIAVFLVASLPRNKAWSFLTGRESVFQPVSKLGWATMVPRQRCCITCARDPGGQVLLPFGFLDSAPWWLSTDGFLELGIKK